MWKMAVLLCLLAFPVAAEQKQVVLGNRTYLIDLPAKPNGSMIVALHNAAGAPEEFRSKIRLSAPALAQGYAVIYPRGTGAKDQLSWNGLYCCGYAQENRIADVVFLDKVIADAAERFGLDAARVYLTGMGNGAVMAETYAVRRTGRVKAVAGVAGTIDLRKAPATRVPLLHIHGLDDRIVPYGADGQPKIGGKRTRYPFTPVPVQIDAFVAAHGGLARTTRVIDRANDAMSVTVDTYSDASGLAKVTLMTVTGGGHVWPGPNRQGAGNTRDISATAEILQFFGIHR